MTRDKSSTGPKDVGPTDDAPFLPLNRTCHWSKGYNPSPANIGVVASLYIHSAPALTSKYPLPFPREHMSNSMNLNSFRIRAGWSENSDGIGSSCMNTEQGDALLERKGSTAVDRSVSKKK